MVITLNFPSASAASLRSPEFLEWLLVRPIHAKLIPAIYSSLLDEGVQLSATFDEKCKALRMSCLMNSLLLKAENDRLVSALTSGQIDVLSLKGPVLAQRLYGGLEQRPFGDLDLLIRPEQTDQACCILSDNGYEDVTRHRKLFHFEFDRVLKSSKRIHVELHRRLIGYAVGDDHLAFGLAGSRGLSEWVWSRAAKTGDTWEMRPSDEFFYLCLHLAKHLIDERRHSVSGHPCSSLLLAMDLHLAIEQWHEEIDWREFLEDVDRFHLNRPVMLALNFVQRWYGAIPEEIESFLNVVSPRMMKYFCSWVEEEHEFSDGPSVAVPHRLEMVVEAFQMADRWSDRIKILPMVFGESIRRGVQSLLARATT